MVVADVRASPRAVAQVGPPVSSTAVKARHAPRWTLEGEVAGQARAFIRASAMPGGALASHPDRTYVNPYLANIAAKGLLTSRDRIDRTTAFEYLSWYGRHSPGGYGTEYRITSGVLEPVGDVDAQDSTAATFLSAYAAATAGASSRERRKLVRLRPTVRAAIRRIAALQDHDGLTWAKPSWRVKYLMDQVEVYWGLSDISRLAGFDRGLNRIVSRVRHRLRAGIAGLWQEGAGMFAIAKHADGTVPVPRADVAYPDVAAQLWVGASDLVGDAQMRRSMELTSKTLGQILDPTASWVVQGEPEPVGFWPLVSVNCRRTGRNNMAAAYEQAMEMAITSSHQAWPYHVGIAGLRLAPPGDA